MDARPASVEGAGLGERREGGMNEQVAGRGSGGGGEGGWEAGDWGRREGPQRHVQGVCTRLQVQVASQQVLQAADFTALEGSGFGMGFAACLPLFCFELE